MGLVDIFLLALGVGSAWLVWDSLQAREIANATLRNACRHQGVLFLDDTVALESLRPVRAPSGRIELQRRFAFQFSDTGRNRRLGHLLMHGHLVQGLDLGIASTSTPDDAPLDGAAAPSLDGAAVAPPATASSSPTSPRSSSGPES